MNTTNENETETTSLETTNSESGLSPRHERFCLEYLKDFNATAAAKRAGYSATSAHNAGSRILTLVPVQTFLHTEVVKINTAISLASRAVNKELLDITYFERGDFLDENGDLKNLKDLPEHLRAAVQVTTRKIKCDDKVTTVTTYNLFNKIQMLEKISKRALPGEAIEAPAAPPVYEDLGDGIMVEV